MISELFFFLQLSERCDKLPMSPSKWDSVEVLTPFVEAINRHDAKALARWMTVDHVCLFSGGVCPVAMRARLTEAYQAR